jgi:hypothetical protein
MARTYPVARPTRIATLYGAEAWCRDHPEADMIPTFATGSASIYPWHCAGNVPEIVEPIEDVDSRGCIAPLLEAAELSGTPTGFFKKFQGRPGRKPDQETNHAIAEESSMRVFASLRSAVSKPSVN